MKKEVREYNSPAISVLKLNSFALMEGLSMAVSDEDAVGGGDAKGGFYFEEEENN